MTHKKKVRARLQHHCPTDNQALRLAPFLYMTVACIGPNLTIKHILKKIIYIFLSLTLITCKSSKIKNLNPTGTYKLGNYDVDSDKDLNEYFGEIQVQRLNNKSILMTFIINKGAPSYNSGSFIDTLDFQNNKALYITPEMDRSCRITFSFTNKGVDVKEQTDDFNSGCGFGHAVVADGFFKKISSKKPELRDPLTDIKIGRE